jgi:hypothetical protein
VRNFAFKFDASSEISGLSHHTVVSYGLQAAFIIWVLFSLQIAQ